MLEIAQIRLPCGTPRGELVKKAAKLLRLKEENFSLRITRHSVDARKKPELLDVYSVAVDLGNPARERKLRNSAAGMSGIWSLWSTISRKEFRRCVPVWRLQAWNGRMFGGLLIMFRRLVEVWRVQTPGYAAGRS